MNNFMFDKKNVDKSGRVVNIEKAKHDNKDKCRRVDSDTTSQEQNTDLRRSIFSREKHKQQEEQKQDTTTQVPGKFTGNRFYTVDNSKTTKFVKKQFYNVSKYVKLNENGIVNKSQTLNNSLNNNRFLEESIGSFNSTDDKIDTDKSDYHDNNDYTNSKSVSFLIDNSDDFANNRNIENNLLPSIHRSKYLNHFKPDLNKAKLQCKMPLRYATDRRISDMKTPVVPTSGRNSRNMTRPLTPIQLDRPKTPKLMKKMKINDDAKNKELENLFLKLDLDEDGHLSYELIENIFCKHLSVPQRSFVKQIYKILSDSTFFGVYEFKTFVYMLDIIRKQNNNTDKEATVPSNYWDEFVLTDFDDYYKDIVEYIKLMETNDLSKPITVLEVMQLKVKRIEIDRILKSPVTNYQRLSVALNYLINKEPSSLSHKILNYITLIPLFIYLESIVQNKIIFQRHKNSILNLKEATTFQNFNKRLVE